MKIAFTGTQQGMQLAQACAFQKLIGELAITAFGHGDCIGADEEAHAMVAEWYSDVYITIHPPTNPSKRAWCESAYICEPKEYLARNRDIVNEGNVLVATPGEMDEQLRSGTWSTIRYARKIGKPVYIIFPDGSIKIELPTKV